MLVTSHFVYSHFVSVFIPVPSTLFLRVFPVLSTFFFLYTDKDLDQNCSYTLYMINIDDLNID